MANILLFPFRLFAALFQLVAAASGLLLIAGIGVTCWLGGHCGGFAGVIYALDLLSVVAASVLALGGGRAGVVAASCIGAWASIWTLLWGMAGVLSFI